MLEPRSGRLAAYVDGLLCELKALRVDGGDSLVSDVRFAREHYPGPRSEHLPDAIVRWPVRPPVSRAWSAGLGELTGEV